uniref:Uncharacterized protein n=1 Tax=Parabacteroides phage SC_7_H3_2017 TaxID=2723238 RepID=A0A6H0X6P4_9VIRU|nr:hypothetical protein [Parabacteroides phage SC_7_H3_2017]
MIADSGDPRTQHKRLILLYTFKDLGNHAFLVHILRDISDLFRSERVSLHKAILPTLSEKIASMLTSEGEAEQYHMIMRTATLGTIFRGQEVTQTILVVFLAKAFHEQLNITLRYNANRGLEQILSDYSGGYMLIIIGKGNEQREGILIRLGLQSVNP